MDKSDWLALLGGAALLGVAGWAAAKHPEAVGRFIANSHQDKRREARREEIRELEEQLDEHHSGIFVWSWVKQARNYLDTARLEEDEDMADLMVVRARRLLRSNT